MKAPFEITIEEYQESMGNNDLLQYEDTEKEELLKRACDSLWSWLVYAPTSINWKALARDNKLTEDMIIVLKDAAIEQAHSIFIYQDTLGHAPIYDTAKEAYISDRDTAIKNEIAPLAYQVLLGAGFLYTGIM